MRCNDGRSSVSVYSSSSTDSGTNIRLSSPTQIHKLHPRSITVPTLVPCHRLQNLVLADPSSRPSCVKECSQHKSHAPSVTMHIPITTLHGSEEKIGRHITIVVDSRDNPCQILVSTPSRSPEQASISDIQSTIQLRSPVTALGVPHHMI